jgi:hypothetical protein
MSGAGLGLHRVPREYTPNTNTNTNTNTTNAFQHTYYQHHWESIGVTLWCSAHVQPAPHIDY